VSKLNLPPLMCVGCGKPVDFPTGPWDALCTHCWVRTPRAMVRVLDRAKTPMAKREAVLRIRKHLGVDAARKEETT